MSGDDGGVFVKAIDKGDHVFRELVGDTEGVFVAGFREAAPEFFGNTAKLKTNAKLDTQEKRSKHTSSKYITSEAILDPFEYI